MRVAWVCEYPASSFPERPHLRHAPDSHAVPWIVVQAPQVAASGIELHIVTVSKHIEADDEFEKDGIHFHFLKIPAVPRAALAYQLDRARIHRCLKRIDPALVQGFGTESSFGYSAVTSPFPSVLMIQGIVARITRARGRSILWRQPGLWISLAVERLTVRRARHVVCETVFAEKFVHEINPSATTHLIRTPIRDDWFGLERRVDAGAGPELLFVGWVVPAKGVDALIAAFARIAADFPTSTLHVVGAHDPGYVQSVLMAQVTRLRLDGRVHFHGSKPSSFVADRLARASMLVLPTLMDTAPNVIAEARAAGVPVVASAVGGVPELIEHGVDGLLVDAGSVESIASAMSRILRDPAAASALAIRGRARVDRDHRLSTQVPKLLDVYRDVLAAARGAA